VSGGGRKQRQWSRDSGGRCRTPYFSPRQHDQESKGKAKGYPHGGIVQRPPFTRVGVGATIRISRKHLVASHLALRSGRRPAASGDTGTVQLRQAHDVRRPNATVQRRTCRPSLPPPPSSSHRRESPHCVSSPLVSSLGADWRRAARPARRGSSPTAGPSRSSASRQSPTRLGRVQQRRAPHPKPPQTRRDGRLLGAATRRRRAGAASGALGGAPRGKAGGLAAGMAVSWRWGSRRTWRPTIEAADGSRTEVGCGRCSAPSGGLAAGPLLKRTRASRLRRPAAGGSPSAGALHRPRPSQELPFTGAPVTAASFTAAPLAASIVAAASFTADPFTALPNGVGPASRSLPPPPWPTLRRNARPLPTAARASPATAQPPSSPVSSPVSSLARSLAAARPRQRAACAAQITPGAQLTAPSPPPLERRAKPPLEPKHDERGRD